MSIADVSPENDSELEQYDLLFFSRTALLTMSRTIVSTRVPCIVNSKQFFVTVACVHSLISQHRIVNLYRVA